MGWDDGGGVRAVDLRLFSVTHLEKATTQNENTGFSETKRGKLRPTCLSPFYYANTKTFHALPNVTLPTISLREEGTIWKTRRNSFKRSKEINAVVTLPLFLLPRTSSRYQVGAD